MRILVVEDEPKLGRLLVRGLGEEGHPADLAAERRRGALDGAGGAVRRDRPRRDAARDRRLRDLPRAPSRGVWTPVLMLTARDAIEDRIAGLDTGADDYLVKPFAFSELLARLRAIAAAGPAERPTELRVGDLRLDPATHRAWRGDAELGLTAKEFVAARGLHAPRPARRSRASSSSTPRGTSPSRATRMSSTCTSATSARRSTALRAPLARDRARRRLPAQRHS